ncbi:MAG: EAL domain-containing protein [Pseudomonadota bacterium]
MMSLFFRLMVWPRRLLDALIDAAVHSDASDMAISSDNVGRLMPFHILVDADGVIRSAGPALLKMVGGEGLVDQSLFDAVRIVKPRRFDGHTILPDMLGKRLTVQFNALGDAVSSRAFGTAFHVQMDGVPHVFFALTPSVNARSFIETHGLKISDFGPTDGSADLVPLLAMQEDMLADSQKKSERLMAARDAAERLANHDPLTQLPNRRALMEGLQAALEQGPVAAIHLDLDKFKEINDTFGHAAGDAALKHAAGALKGAVGEDALCARLGGDEFVGVLAGAMSHEALNAIVDDLFTRLSEACMHDGVSLRIGASIGLAAATPADAIGADTILHHADLALLEAKRAGRGNVVFCTQELLQAQGQFQKLSGDILRGLSSAEFVAFLQPQVDVKSGQVIGAEALARWQHPERGLLGPSEFLDAAQRAGLLQQIDAVMRQSALDALMLGDANGTPLPKVSINVTTRDLIDPAFRDILLWDLEKRELTPSRVVIEIVESVLFDENSNQITQACRALVEDGFFLALDDFGTGHASILSLVNLPLSIVKIDRAFSAGVARDSRRQAMARSMVGMATTLGLDVIAEAVEGEADVLVFNEIDCTCFQSFHFGGPMPPEQFFAWLATQSRTIGHGGQRAS